MSHKQWLLLFGLIIIVCTSCNKDTIVQNDQQVGKSRISYYPLVITTGSRLVIINLGGSFTDSGATASIHNVPTTVTASGSVDNTTPGIYNITYTAKNSDGFAGSDFRTIVVLGTDISANDFSGTYVRGSTGATSTWTKMSDGVYLVDNPGGAGSGYGFDVIVVNYSGLNIAIPQQMAFDPSLNGYNTISSSNNAYLPTPPPPSYEWVLSASGYGASTRIFVKQ
jgi:hypothetical protein